MCVCRNEGEGEGEGRGRRILKMLDGLVLSKSRRLLEMTALKGRQCTAGGAALAEPPDHRLPSILALKGRQKRTCQIECDIPGGSEFLLISLPNMSVHREGKLEKKGDAHDPLVVAKLQLGATRQNAYGSLRLTTLRTPCPNPPSDRIAAPRKKCHTPGKRLCVLSMLNASKCAM